MKEIMIRNNYSLDIAARLTFDDSPVVIAYCPLYASDGFEASLLLQVRDIHRALRQSFGPRGCNIIWVFEEIPPAQVGGDHGGVRRQGLQLVAKLIRRGYAKTLVIHRMDRIARRPIDWFAFSDAIIEPCGVDVLIAREPLAGSHPDVEYLHWLVEFEAGMASTEDHPHVQSFIDEPDLSSDSVAVICKHSRPTMFVKHIYRVYPGTRGELWLP